MINLHKCICLLITISVLITHAAEFDKKFQHLPNTIVELKQYYDVIESLEQRTILGVYVTSPIFLFANSTFANGDIRGETRQLANFFTKSANKKNCLDVHFRQLAIF